MAATALSKKSNEALDRLEKFWLGQEVTPTPEGSFTVEEYVQRVGSTTAKAARARLNLMVKQGVVEKHKMQTFDVSGRRVESSVYTPTGKE
jgi:predicted transcriptional regulator